MLRTLGWVGDLWPVCRLHLNHWWGSDIDAVGYERTGEIGQGEPLGRLCLVDLSQPYVGVLSSIPEYLWVYNYDRTLI